MAVTVLIVDDDAAVRDTLARKLRSEEFGVLSAKNGLEGLRMFHAGHPDLVILDIVMPEMDGVTVCRRIREIADTPVMMLSAQASFQPQSQASTGTPAAIASMVAIPKVSRELQR